MGDDIVTRLYCSYADPPCEACTFCVARAEIERLRTADDELHDDLTRLLREIKRLRAAGDALASAFEEIPQWPEWFYKVYETWLEARNGK